MSQVDRSQVFQNIRVRTSLKNDTCWIQKSEQENKEQDNARTDQAVENTPIRPGSYVLSTAKRFEYRSHTPTEQLIQTVEAQPEKCVSNMTTENNDEYTDTTVDQSNIKTNEGTVSADVPLETHTQNGETVFPVEPTGQPAVNTKAENKEVYVHTAVDQSSGEHNDVRVIIGAYAEGLAAEICAAAGTEESRDGAEVPAVLPVKPRPEEELPTEMETANATNLMDAAVESTVQPAEGGGEERPPQQTTEETVETVETVVDVLVEPPRDTSDVITAAPGEEAAPQDSVEPVLDSFAKSVSELLKRRPAEIATEGSGDSCPPEQAAVETVEAVVDVNVKSSPEFPGVTNNASGEEATPQESEESVPNLVVDTDSQSLGQPAAETAAKSVETLASAEPVLHTTTGETTEREVQPADNSLVTQSVEPAPENAAAHVADLSAADAIEPVRASDAESAQDKSANRAIELTDALDVEPPTTGAAAESLKGLEKEEPHDAEESWWNKQSVDTHVYRKGVCSFCDKIIEGNVRIIFDELLVNCHPDCLRCALCAKALGDMQTPMCVHNQAVVCGECFGKTL